MYALSLFLSLPPPPLSLSLSFSPMHSQLVQTQAPCPPPQTQRWRSWTQSTSSSFSSTSTVSTDSQLPQRFTSSISTHTHMLLCTWKRWLSLSSICKCSNTHTVYLDRPWFRQTVNTCIHIILMKWCMPETRLNITFHMCVKVKYTSSFQSIESGCVVVGVGTWVRCVVSVCVTFVTLLPDCRLKVKDVLREFDADGRLAQHRHGEVRGNHSQVYRPRKSSALTLS